MTTIVLLQRKDSRLSGNGVNINMDPFFKYGADIYDTSLGCPLSPLMRQNKQ
jgi:hypothetical protein